MTVLARLPGSPVVGMAPPLRPAAARRPGSRRRATLVVAVLALAVVTVLVAKGMTGAGAGSPPSEPETSPGTAGPGAEPARARPRETQPHPRTDRVVAPKHAAALFAERSWYVAPKPAPPPPPPPPPEPTAPPLPYSFVGSYAPAGEAPVFFLARGDRVIDAHVGDRLEGVYQFESAAGGQLVFVYLPLNIRQNLATSVPR